jgi:hypothetical protein
VLVLLDKRTRLLKGIPYEEPNRGDFFFLANPVDSCQRLLLDRGVPELSVSGTLLTGRRGKLIPMRLHKVRVRGFSQCQTRVRECSVKIVNILPGDSPNCSTGEREDHDLD